MPPLITDGLRQAEDQLKLFIESVRDRAIVMLDAKGCILTWNAGAERIKGFQPGDVIGKHFSILHSAEDIQRGMPERALKIAAEEGDFQVECWCLRKDGSRFRAEVVITAIRDADGGIRGFGEVTRDITGQKRAEEEIRQLNAELEAFSYSVSHDLRAPLRAVDGFSRAVLEDFGAQLPEEGQRYLQRIREGAQRMGILIDDLLTLSRMSRAPLSKRKVNTEELVRGVLDDLRFMKEGRQIELHIGNLPECTGDPDLLKQVWSNLLSNAFKYTRQRAVTVVEAGCVGDSGENVYFVRDNGTGFDMRYAHKLFGVFQRLHGDEEYEGTGVGLAIVQRIMHRHGGRVWAEAAVDRGATFHFTMNEKTGL